MKAFGCYITKHGFPGRDAGFIRWETTADSYLQFGAHFLLFSSQFIEIREIQSSKLVQVIPGDGLQQLHQSTSAILIANKNKRSNVGEDVIELSETTEIAPFSSPPLSARSPAW
jgi:RHO1 GDP-GTP exchange protein 1/2